MSRKEPKNNNHQATTMINELKYKPLNINMNIGVSYFDHFHQYNSTDSIPSIEEHQSIKYFPSGFHKSNYSFIIEPTTKAPPSIEGLPSQATTTFSIVYRSYFENEELEERIKSESPMKGQVLFLKRSEQSVTVQIFSHSKYSKNQIEIEELSQVSSRTKTKETDEDDKLIHIICENEAMVGMLKFETLNQESMGIYTFMNEKEGFCCYDLIQGSKTQPSFGSALSLMIEIPSLLQIYLNLNKENTDMNEVDIPICLQGSWSRIKSRNSLLVNRTSKEPMLSCTKNLEYWVHLVEKASIACYGSNRNYTKRTRSILYTLHNLTGAPYQELFLKKLKISMDDLDSLLKYIIEYRYLACLSIRGPFEQFGQKGLYGGTIYHLVDHLEARDGSSIYAIRYPWNNLMDPPEYRINKQAVSMVNGGVNGNPKYEGCFFMTADEILDKMEVLQVLRVDLEAYQYGIRLNEEPNPFLFVEVDIKNYALVTFQLSQAESFESNYELNSKFYHKIGMVIVKKSKDEKGSPYLQVITQHVDSNRDIWCSQDLKPGTYFVVV